jgi:hypothetical protein
LNFLQNRIEIDVPKDAFKFLLLKIGRHVCDPVLLPIGVLLNTFDDPPSLEIL